MVHYEMTSEARIVDGQMVHRIKALEDLPHLGVSKGDRGGFVQSQSNLTGSAWVFGEAVVMQGALVTDQAHVHDMAVVGMEAVVSGLAYAHGQAFIFGNARLQGTSRVGGHCKIHGDAVLAGSADLRGGVHVKNNAYVGGKVRLEGTQLISSHAVITDNRHILTIDPVGSEDVTLTLTRTTDGHRLRVGCWSGTVDQLAGEVARRALINWEFVQDPAVLKAEYFLAEQMVRDRIASWGQTEETP